MKPGDTYFALVGTSKRGKAEGGRGKAEFGAAVSYVKAPGEGSGCERDHAACTDIDEHAGNRMGEYCHREAVPPVDPTE